MDLFGSEGSFTHWGAPSSSWKINEKGITLYVILNRIWLSIITCTHVPTMNHIAYSRNIIASGCRCRKILSFSRVKMAVKKKKRDFRSNNWLFHLQMHENRKRWIWACNILRLLVEFAKVYFLLVFCMALKVMTHTGWFWMYCLLSNCSLLY